MAVVYATGVAATPLDLLSKLAAFANANGWSTDNLSDNAATFEHATENVRAAAKASTDHWDTRGLISINTLLDIDNQVNQAPTKHVTNWGAGPFTAYHFYSGAELGAPYLHVTVEVQAAQYRHWILGGVVKFGAIVGGMYTDSTYLEDVAYARNQPDSGYHRALCDACNTQAADAFVQVDYDSKVNNWQAIRGVGNLAAEGGTGSYRYGGIINALIMAGPQAYNLLTPIYPLEYFVNRASNLRSSIGRIPDFGAVNMQNISPGELVTYGSDTWQVFPLFTRFVGAAPESQVSSGLYGYAHKR